MGFQGAAFFLVVAVLIAAAVYGAVTSKRSVLLALAALGLAGLAALGCWYAATETRSMPWTVGYGAIVAGSLVVAVRQLMGKSS